MPVIERREGVVAGRHEAVVRDRRVVLTVVMLAVIGASFWAGSRVPALNEKALMGGDAQLEALGF